MKKMTSLLLALVLCLTLCVPAFAYSANVSQTGKVIQDNIQYRDSNGTICNIDLTIDQDRNIVTTATDTVQNIFDLTANEVTIIHSDGRSSTRVINLPDAVQAPSFGPRARSFEGTLQFKTYYNPNTGMSMSDALKIYSTNNGTLSDIYEINGELYDSISMVVGFFVSYLVGKGIGDIAQKVGAEFLGYILSTGITVVVDDEIRKAFVTPVRSQSTYYDLDANDPATGRVRSYTGSMHRVTSVGGSFNNVYYAGYYPQFLTQRDSVVAYWLFSDFWTYDYPGVSRYG